MATARDLIARAHRVAGLVKSGDAMPEADYLDGLAALNEMIDAWRAHYVFVVASTEVVANVSASPVSIGVGGQIDAEQPLAMADGAFVIDGAARRPIRWIDRARYHQLLSMPPAPTALQFGYYDAAAGEIYLLPEPSQPVDLYVQLHDRVQAFADLAQDYPLIAGCERAITYSLAEERNPDPKLVATASAARLALRNNNVCVPVSQMDYAEFPPPYFTVAD